MATIGDKFKNLREYTGFSLKELAQASGVPRKDLGEIEKGQKWPSLKEAKSVCSVFGLDTSFLFAEEKKLCPILEKIAHAKGASHKDKEEIAKFASFLSHRKGAADEDPEKEALRLKEELKRKSELLAKACRMVEALEANTYDDEYFGLGSKREEFLGIPEVKEAIASCRWDPRGEREKE